MSTEQQHSKWQLFFMLIFIPCIFAIILVVVLTYYMGFNVGERVQQAASFLPFVNEQEEEEDIEVILEDQLFLLENENASFQRTITELEAELQRRNDEIVQLQDELLLIRTDLENELDRTSELQLEIRDVVRTLEGISGARAADIVSEMDQDEAIMLLKEMGIDSRSQILSRLNPSEAAEIISRLAE
ncbi:hypothetical protein QA612_11880 [Evansella sp. AB-P1]|uniref:MotE family protein n=1 Tax=Evansella sp. AB-P1 TaxID=3037653 RepID=UPI00241E4DB6|nr:hypothetical protein [Evansella sp. AB-P1]MDG5788188.1 hypothetical protein [Evansella sp. AB-P1]